MIEFNLQPLSTPGRSHGAMKSSGSLITGLVSWQPCPVLSVFPKITSLTYQKDSFIAFCPCFRISLVAQTVKNLPVMWETQDWSLGQEDALEKYTHSSILPWRISWAEESGGLKSMGFIESDMTENALLLRKILKFVDLWKTKEPIILPPKWVYLGKTELPFRTIKLWGNIGKSREQRRRACFSRGKEEITECYGDCVCLDGDHGQACVGPENHSSSWGL